MNLTEQPQSEFNSAISFLNRLNGLHWLANDYALNLDLHMWFQTLLALHRTLITEMQEPVLLEINALIEKITPRLSNYNRRTSNKTYSFIPYELLNMLHEFEIKLLLVEKKAGISLKMKQLAGEAISHGTF